MILDRILAFQIQVVPVILIYCVYLQEEFFVFAYVLCFNLTNSLSGGDCNVLLAHRFHTTSPKTFRL